MIMKVDCQKLIFLISTVSTVYQRKIAIPTMVGRKQLLYFLFTGNHAENTD